MDKVQRNCSAALLLASNPDFNELSELAPEGLVLHPVTFTLNDGSSSGDEGIEMFERLGYSMVQMAVEEPSNWIDNIQDNFESLKQDLNQESYLEARQRKIELNEKLQDDLESGAELFKNEINYDQTVETSVKILEFCRKVLETSKASEEIDARMLQQTIRSSETVIKTGTVLDLQPYIIASLMISDQSNDLEFINAVSSYITELEQTLGL